MAYRNKTYVCFDGDNDIRYYRLMTAWKAKDNIDFNFHNAHDLNNIWINSNEVTIKRRLRERMKDTKLLIVLIGEKTKNLFRFVRWEIEVAQSLGIPIIAVNLNKKKKQDNKLCPAIIKDKLVLHVPFNQKAIKWAIDNWISREKYWLKKGTNNSIVIKDATYKEWGI